MLRRPWHTWAAFAACLAVVLAAMGWISVTVVRLDHMEQVSQRQSEREENVRLALWRMDSALAPLIAQESARPYFAYGAFYPAERAYTRMFNEINNGDVLVPSPLLTQPHPHTLLHFQIAPDGQVTSPQVPAAERMKLAQLHCAPSEKLDESGKRLIEVRARVKAGELLALIPAAPSNPQPPPQIAVLSDEDLAQFAQQVAQLDEPKQQQEANQAGQTLNNPPKEQMKALMKQAQRSNAELQKRKSNYQETSQNLWVANGNNKVPGGPDVVEGVLQPLWFKDMLLLVRRVAVNGKPYVQGCWLDWPAIQKSLAASVSDLLPNAQLEPVLNQNDRPTLQMAALPVRLLPGLVPMEALPALTPLRISLLVAWACVLLAAAAVAALLMGAMSLSERRGAFVSAVTHELRTPLTTFRMYTEMLTDGMVKDEEKQARYLNTLRAEATRLSHLVENVLAYARLEGGAVASRAEDVSWPQFVEKIQERLNERAAQAEMELVIAAPQEHLRFHADPSAVEQVLFNLVDNACKYGQGGTAKRIEIDARNGGANAVIRVRDHGPGVSADVKKRLFQPFSKSAQQAAHSAPGVGLGLALSRGLARDMGGDLQLDLAANGGACFELTLPAV